MTILIALGTNIGDRTHNIAKALKLIKAFASIKTISSIFHSKALLKKDAPHEWNQDFINLVLCCETSLSPIALLQHIKTIEYDLGRNHSSPVWSPRVIDLDIIIYGDIILNSPILQIPHKEMTKRDFVILPMLEIIPRYRYHNFGTIEYQMSLTQIYHHITEKTVITH